MDTNPRGGSTQEKIDVYQIITDRILSLLDKGVIPWRKPWSAVSVGAGAPKSLVSKKAYRGINVSLLACAGFGSSWWITFRQAKELGGSVRKGEKGTPVVYWNWIKRNPKTGEKARGDDGLVHIPFLRYYTLFNATQVDGIADKVPQAEAPVEPVSPIEAAETIVQGFKDGPVIHRDIMSDRAFYSPITDRVCCPPLEQHANPAQHYSTLFHELGHSTGHERRLNRPGIVDRHLFGAHEYSVEELVAEFTSTFLCAEAGLERETIENSAAYIDSWSSVLKKDRKIIVQAAGQAQKAADLILGREWDRDRDREPKKEEGSYEQA